MIDIEKLKEEIYLERIDFTSPETAEEEVELVMKYLRKYHVFDGINMSIVSYNKLTADQNKLRALEAAGVDNWEGYDYAMSND